MKLAKTLIVSGLLFSSILGSVNVGSITAMAADDVLSTSEEVKFSVFYQDENGNPLTETQGLPTTVTPEKNVENNPINKDSFRAPEGYESVSYDSSSKTVTFKKIKSNTIKTVEVTFKNGSEIVPNGEIKTIEDGDGNGKLSVKEIGTSIPAGYELVTTTDITVSNGKADIPVKAIKENGKKVTVIFVNEKNQAIKGLVNESVDLGQDGKVPLQNVHAPQGYTIIPGQNPIVTKDNKVNVKVKANRTVSRPSAPRHTIQRVRITFVDQNAKDIVGYKQVTGKSSTSTKIEAPKNYTFANEKDATIKFDKKGNKDIKIFVKKMTAAPIKHEGIVTTTNGSYKRLYTLEGKMITNRAISGNSKWYTDQYATVNGEKMYRVATNEWVKASDVL